MPENSNQSNLQIDIEALREDLAKVQRDMREVADTLVNMGRHQATEIRERVSQQMESGAESLQQLVEHRPVATLAVAFAVGLLAGKLFGR